MREGPPPIQRGEFICKRIPLADATDPFQCLDGVRVEISEAICLEPIGEDPEQQIAAEMLRGSATELGLPAPS